MSGLPEHAWDIGIVEDLLSPFCSIRSICRPLFCWPKFIVEAFASSVDAIPSGCSLAIGESTFSNNLADAWCGIGGWPNKRCVYHVTFKTKLYEPTLREEEGNSSMESGYGYDSDREPMGW